MSHAEETAQKILDLRGYVVIRGDHSLPVGSVMEIGARFWLVFRGQEMLPCRLHVVTETDREDYLEQCRLVPDSVKELEPAAHYYRVIAE